MQQEENKIENRISEGEIATLLADAEDDMRHFFDAEKQGRRIEETRGNEKGGRIFYFIRSFVLPILYGIFIALILTQVMYFHAQVPSGSMETTILTGDRILGNRMAYWFQDPSYGDIIIFWSDEYNEFMVKRIIGCPGDRVELHTDGVYVNDNRLADAYTQGITREMRVGESAWTVPEDSYFVMGDNREDSADSRYWNDTYVPREEIYAKYMFRYSLGTNGWYLKWNQPVEFWLQE